MEVDVEGDGWPELATPGVAEMVTRVATAVRRDLRAIAKRDPELAKSGLAQSSELCRTRSSTDW